MLQNTQRAPRTVLAFVVICALQALVVWLAPADVLARYPVLNDFVEAVRSIAPAVGNYDKCNDAPEIMRLLMATMIALIPLQVWIFWRWLHASKHDNYRHFIVSPDTPESPTSSLDFIRDANPDLDVPDKTVRYSLTRKLIFFFLLALVTVGFVWVFFKEAGQTVMNQTTAISHGCRSTPIEAWLGLSPFYWLGSFLIAILAVTTRDFVNNLIIRRRGP